MYACVGAVGVHVIRVCIWVRHHGRGNGTFLAQSGWTYTSPRMH
jgi:hypothetical protein